MRRVTIAEESPPCNILQFECSEQPHKQVSGTLEAFFLVYSSREWGSCCL